MKIQDYFDVENKQHIHAVQHFNSFGAFPDGFLHKGIEFATGDMKVVNVMLKVAGYSVTPKEPEDVTYDALADAEDIVDSTDEATDFSLGNVDEE